jgi:Flp pilus assembly protein TadG
MLGMGAMALDFGRAFVAFHQLQSASDAAALAGAEQLPNSTAASWAQTYSAGSGGLNSYSWMGNVTVTITPECLATLTGAGMGCVAPANANALQVTESVNLPTFFARLFGMNSIPISTESTAAMRGSSSVPYNIAVIVDTTASMNTVDSDSQCGAPRISCALQGVQILLQNMEPCSTSLTACGSATANSNGGADVTNPVDEVSLFAFPNVTTATVANDYSCSSNPTIPGEYQFPVATDTSYLPGGPAGNFILGTGGTTDPSYNSTYQVVGFSSDYRLSDTATTLNASSNIVMAAGGASGCPGMAAPGGQGTYYAGVIYAAQAALEAEQASRIGVNSQNVIILISDGQAQSQPQTMGGTTFTNGVNVGGANNTGTYPSTVNECAQAVTAAQYATSQGTRIYAVAYGAEAAGCTTASGGTDTSSITPCQTMQGIASSPTYFYSDYTATGSSGDCVSASQSTTNLNQIFFDIATDFTAARLIPNGTT